MAVTRPVVEDLLAWIKLQSAPSGESLAVYTEALGVGQSLVESRIDLPEGTTDDDYPAEVRTAILMTAARLAKRSTSPEGVAGFGDLGVIRILSRDPDVEVLLARFLKLDGFY